jgi:pimeloyl-ACP methyl ester carboxylesterase
MSLPSWSVDEVGVTSMYHATKFVRIPYAGHWVQYETANDVNQLLLDFFG